MGFVFSQTQTLAGGTGSSCLFPTEATLPDFQPDWPLSCNPPPSTSPGTKGWHQKSLSFARMLSKAVVHSVLYFFCVCRVLSILCPSASFFSFSPLCLRCSFFSFLFSFFSLFLFFFYFSFSLIFIIIFKYTRRIFYTYVFKRPEKK